MQICGFAAAEFQRCLFHLTHFDERGFACVGTALEHEHAVAVVACAQAHRVSAVDAFAQRAHGQCGGDAARITVVA